MEPSGILIVGAIVVGVLLIGAMIHTWIVVHEAATAAREYFRRANIEARLDEEEAGDGRRGR